MERFDSVGRHSWQVVDKTLVVSGLLLEPGTFTTSDGKTLSFDGDAVKKIYEKIDQNMPFILTHNGDNKIIGYATKFSLSSSDQILYQGYVFDDKEKVQNGFDSVSGEFDCNVETSGNVLDGNLERIAFVSVPAVGRAEVLIKKEVKMSGKEGEDPSTEEVDIKEVVSETLESMAEMGHSTKAEFGRSLKSKLKKGGLDAPQIDAVVTASDILLLSAPSKFAEGKPTMQEWLKKMKDALTAKGFDRGQVSKIVAVVNSLTKTPYPYAQANNKEEGLEEMSGLQDELSAKQEELDGALTQLEGYYETELGKLKNEVTELGFKADGMIDGMDVSNAITFLQKVKEGVASSKPDKEKTKITGEDNVADILEELGLEGVEIA